MDNINKQPELPKITKYSSHLPINEPKQATKVTIVSQKPLKKDRLVKSEETKLGWLPNTTFTERQRNLIRKLVAKDLNDDEFNLFVYRCLSLRLDPLKGEVSVHKRKDSQTGEMKMVMVVQRDGYLTIAHRSGQFNGMSTDVQFDDKGNAISATCEVYNKSAEYPIKVKVYMKEYNTQKQLWMYKPITMIQKVAESQALRRAFNISGVYSEEELDSWNGIKKELPTSSDDGKLAQPSQISVIKKLGGEVKASLTFGEAKAEIETLLNKK